MTDETTGGISFRRRLVRMARRLLGTDVIATDVTQQVKRDLVQLGDAVSHQIAEQLEACTTQWQAHLNARTQALLEACTAQLQAHLIARTQALQEHSENFQRALASEVQRALASEVRKVVFENRIFQNTYFSRDNLPSRLAVKQFYLQIKAAIIPFEFDDVGVSIFSQNNEDGILMYIFSQIGMKTRRSIEVGCDLSGSTIGVPEGNTINLITNLGFDGLIIDIDPEKISSIRHFFARSLATQHFHAPARDGIPAHYFSPKLVAQEVTVENINTVFSNAGFIGEIDLLSIDVDGADILMWQAVEVVNPRVVVIEVSNRIPFDQLVYGHASTSTAPRDSLEYQASASSSLAAACETAATKGYIFIGMDATLLNAFFIRQDIERAGLPERHLAEYLSHRMNPLLERGAPPRSDISP